MYDCLHGNVEPTVGDEGIARRCVLKAHARARKTRKEEVKETTARRGDKTTNVTLRRMRVHTWFTSATTRHTHATHTPHTRHTHATHTPHTRHTHATHHKQRLGQRHTRRARLASSSQRKG
jgi:hypothetical protein